MYILLLPWIDAIIYSVVYATASYITNLAAASLADKICIGLWLKCSNRDGVSLLDRLLS